MKKIYLAILAIFCALYVQAQIAPIDYMPIDNSLIPHAKSNANGNRSATNLWIEYDSADTYFTGSQQFSIQWLMNKRYPVTSTLSNYLTFNNYIVKFDSLVDINTSFQAFPNDSIQNMTIDSFYTVIGHQNSSGLNDTIIVKIINVDTTQRYPMLFDTYYPGSTVLWSDTLITNTSLSPSQKFTHPVSIMWTPNFTSTTLRRFAVQVEYYGSFQDTAAFLAGVNKQAPPNGICTYRAGLSSMFPNSYEKWCYSTFAPFRLLPDTSGVDFLLDCNLRNGFEPDSDSYSYLQNIVVGAYLTVNNVSGVNEMQNLGMSLMQNTPNPTSGTTTLRYEIASAAKDVRLDIYDVVGSKVMEIKEGNKPQGKFSVNVDTSPFAKGIYTYTLRVDGKQLTKKMIVE